MLKFQPCKEDKGLKAGIKDLMLGFETCGWDLDLETRVGALRQEFGP